MECPLYLEVWKTIQDHLSISSCWGIGSLHKYFQNWFTEEDLYKLLPIFVSWSIWISRNSSVFLDIRPNDHICNMRILNLFKEYENLVYKRITKKLFKPTEVSNGAIGFFDGASKLYNYGCGFVLNLSKDHFLYFSFGGGLGTNTKVELLSLYGLLLIASLLGVLDIGIYGDSKIIIDWQNGL